MREVIAAALKDAMRNRDPVKLGVLRLVAAVIKDRDVDARGRGEVRASHEDLLGLLAEMIRQREEAAATYDRAGRSELADKERAEIAVIRTFLLKPLTDEEVAAREAVVEVGASTVRDMGRVMATLKARYAGRMDFSKANGAVKWLLA